MLVKMWSRGNTEPSLVGVQACTASIESSVAVPPEDGNSPPRHPAAQLLRICPRDPTSCSRDISSSMTIAALVIIIKDWKQPRCLPVDEPIMQMWSIYTVKYYLTVKKNEIMELADKGWS